VCTADACDPLVGCVSEPIRGCCTEDGDCDAGETCDPDTNACVPLTASSSGGGESSGGTPADTGLDESGGGTGVGGTGSETSAGGSTGVGGSSGDTGAGLDDGGSPSASGCGCTTSPHDRSWLLLLGPLGLLRGRRRRIAVARR
jgi:MYXO-CTERM domain-containing protein